MRLRKIETAGTEESHVATMNHGPINVKLPKIQDDPLFCPHHHTAGTGPLYQGRFKSFPIQQDDHFLMVCRYVERNALRAGLVKRAQDWQHGSLFARRLPEPPAWLLPSSEWPVAPPRDWIARVNRPQSKKELEAIRTSVKRGRPYGEDRWQRATAKKLSLESTLHPRGRQRVREIKDSRPL